MGRDNVVSGKVYLVGGGPGDPGLITVKGMRSLERAQVVVYDRLVDPSLLQAVPSSAELIYVGKERGRHALSQDEINQLLVDRASAGKIVVRLKGGDPFVFGRGGEEALALAERGLPFEVVPGVTSAIAGAAYAGVPITHRGVATSFTVVSGSEDPSKPDSTVDWGALARTGGTLVVLMGWAALEPILATLQKHGMSTKTPTALIQWGTWPDQKTVTGCLDNILELGQEAGLEPPVLAVVGDVVSLREKLAWFDRKPLSGKRVLVTRSRTQASRFREILEDLGAQPVELPAIEIAPLEDFTELDAAVDRLSEFQWVIFASGNAVDSVFNRLGAGGRDARAFAASKIGAIGPATAEALLKRGLVADFVPQQPVSAAILQELSDRSWSGLSVFLPGADIGRDELARGLGEFGADVHRIAAYRNVPAKGVAGRAKEAFAAGVDAVTFTSSSTVRNLMDMMNGDKRALDSAIIACIGPVTAGTAQELGLKVDLVADDHTVEGLANALVAHYSREETVSHG